MDLPRRSSDYPATLVLALVSVACGDGSATPTATALSAADGTTAASSSTGTQTESTAGTETTGSSGPSSDSTAGSTESGEGTTGDGCRCSEDLQSVVCDDEVTETCAPGTYCSAGACAPLTPCGTAEFLQSSVGCDFWAVKTELLEPGGSGSCFAAFIANAGVEPAHLAVEYGAHPLDVAAFARIPKGQGAEIEYLPYDAELGLPAGEVAILFLSRGSGENVPCPTLPAIKQETEVVGTGYGKAFHITSDRPVAAYAILPYGGGSSGLTAATLLLPTTVWDREYLAINAYRPSEIIDDARNSLTVVAAEDGTEVTIKPKVAILGGEGVPGTAAGAPITYSLERGQVLQIAQRDEITGSPVTANKPVGVFGGANCFNVPPTVITCDTALQQLPPIRALGSTYAAVRYRNRTKQEETPPWRLVGAADGTALSYIPAKPQGAPDTLDLGAVVEFASAGPFLVQSQDTDHPFYLAAYMTGSEAVLQSAGAGDPEWVNVVPTTQYLDRYVFFTDPTYPDTSLVVVRTRTNGAFAPVVLDCAGELGGWQALGDDHEWTRVNLVVGNFEDQGACSNGRHEMSSTSPFGVTVWGWGSYYSGDFYSQSVSYAYPAGASIRSINDIMLPPQ